MLQNPNNKGYIYVIKASEEKDSVYKIGRTIDLKTRLRNHNAAHANDLEVMYRYRTDDVVAVEGCLKSMLKKYGTYNIDYKDKNPKFDISQ